MSFAAFILSTGRCGTQWIAQSLGGLYADCIAVEHEPLHDRYQARKTLGYLARSESEAALSPTVCSHMEAIERQLESRSYLECGHPNWSTIPLLAERFRGRVRIVHLTRHPIPTSLSWLTHSAYQLPVLPHLAEKILLSPEDEGIKFTEYRHTWEKLSPFEKCLFYWAEVNALGLESQSCLNVAWLWLKYEDLFYGDGLQRLLAFLDLPPRDQVRADRSVAVDQYRCLTGECPDYWTIKNHPRVIEVVRELGYSLAAVDEEALRRRYLAQRTGR